MKLKQSYTISDCQQLELSQISDVRGSLTFVEGRQHIPFDIRRVYFIYDVHSGSQRAGHAHKELFQVLIAVAGSFDVHLNDGIDCCTYTLNRPYQGLLITPMIWRVIDNFSSGSVCLALASAQYEESDYYRDYDQFLQAAQAVRGSVKLRMSMHQ